MDEALLSLLEKKDFEYISVREICAAAGVNRSTFYLHYENTSDLLREAVESMQKEFLAYFSQENETFFDKLAHCAKEELHLVTPAYLTPYLTFIRDHKRLYATAVRSPSNFLAEETYRAMFTHIFDPILARFSVPREERGYMMAFYLRGIAAVVDHWLVGDCADPIERVVSVILRCIPALPKAGKGV